MGLFGGVAVVVGVVLLFNPFAASTAIPSWGWLALAGAVNMAVGILALARPEATVRILAPILGLQP